jgi:hypothetical protein
VRNLVRMFISPREPRPETPPIGATSVGVSIMGVEELEEEDEC